MVAEVGTIGAMNEFLLSAKVPTLTAVRRLGVKDRLFAGAPEMPSGPSPASSRRRDRERAAFILPYSSVTRVDTFTSGRYAFPSPGGIFEGRANEGDGVAAPSSPLSIKEMEGEGTKREGGSAAGPPASAGGPVAASVIPVRIPSPPSTAGAPTPTGIPVCGVASSTSFLALT